MWDDQAVRKAGTFLPGDIVTASPRVGRAAIHRHLPSLDTPAAVLGYDETATVIATAPARTWAGRDEQQACLLLFPHTCTVGWTYGRELEVV